MTPKINHPEVAAWIVALEDKRFFNHKGVDPFATVRAYKNYALGRAYGGASTIDMQLCRIFTDERSRTVSRKVREIARAIQMNGRISKHEILWYYTELCYVSSEHFSISSAYKPLKKVFGIEFPDFDRFMACLPKYPAPSDLNENWLQRVRNRYNYAHAKKAIQEQSLVRLLSAPSA